jgi:hypothetical protein
MQLKMLTRTPGEVSDVALVPSGDSWVVGWVDERDGDPEVYAARIAPSLQRVGAEQRVTETPGSAVDLKMLPLGDQVLLVWSDTHGSKARGFADVSTALVSQSTAAVTRPAAVARATLGHSYAPAVSAYGEHAVVAWLEQKSDADVAHVLVGRFDASGAMVGEIQRIDTPATEPSALVIDCSTETRCHLLFAGQEADQALLYGVSFEPGRGAKATPLLALSGSPSQTPLLTLTGDVAYVAAQSADGQPIVRRLSIAWD